MKFKCNQSGNTVEFFQEHEIAEMRKHAGYTEVPPEAPKAPTTPSTCASALLPCVWRLRWPRRKAWAGRRPSSLKDVEIQSEERRAWR